MRQDGEIVLPWHDISQTFISEIHYRGSFAVRAALTARPLGTPGQREQGEQSELDRTTA